MNDRLRVRMAASRAPFEAAMTQTLRAEARDLLAEPRPILVESSATGRRFVIYLLPITAGALSDSHFLTRTRAIVLAIEQKSAEPPDPAIVRDILEATLGRPGSPRWWVQAFRRNKLRAGSALPKTRRAMC